jgi:ribonuclease HI
MNTNSLQTVRMYTDGSCKGNPGPGGWAAILMYGEHKKELSGYEDNTTNNRMELKAIIEGIKALKRPVRLEVVTDSQYVSKAINEGWLSKWQSKGWQTSAKTSVKNRDLWEELLQLMKKHKITFIWTKGHADDELNNEVDALSQAAAERVQEALSRKG